jgi:hypothetical protein
MSAYPRVIVENRQLRIVKLDEAPHYVLEKFEGRDAMGQARWASLDTKAPFVITMRDWILQLVKELPEDVLDAKG